MVTTTPNVKKVYDRLYHAASAGTVRRGTTTWPGKTQKGTRKLLNIQSVPSFGITVHYTYTNSLRTLQTETLFRP